MRPRLIPVPLVTAALVLVALALAPAREAAAACAGSCGADFTAVPKTVEKYVKQRWKAVVTCGKRGTPACPAACPVPDGTADPYLLSASCVGLIDCELDALAETTYGAAWDDVAFCPLAVATSCEQARAENAGKLVSTKLKRRRTSKMDKLPKDTSKCVDKIEGVLGCDAGPCADAGDWIDAVFPIGLTKGGYQTLPFSVGGAGEGTATLAISSGTAGWDLLETESVVLGYDVDGVPTGTIVVYGGSAVTDYRILLGALAPGEHVLGLRHEKKLSPAKKSPVSITASPSVESIPSGDPRYHFTRFAPILLGIDTDLNEVSAGSGPHLGNAVSDVPVIVYVKATAGVGLTTYRYTMIWSNEDGGTGLFPDLLIARFGRTTDIETIVEVDVSDMGSLLAVRFRPDESGSLDPFGGVFQGTHPVVRTATANGLIADDGESTLRFALPPLAFDDAGLPRELGMDLDPISYVLMAVEMVREDKIESPGSATTKKLSDLRNYLYVDYDIDVSVGGQVLRGVAVVGGISYYSDHDQSFSPALNPRVAEGIGRLAIEVPPGTAIGDIEQYGMQGIGTMSGTLFSADAFMLDAGYLPGTPLTFSGSLGGSGTNPSWLVTPP
jgi:hypothetical protein